MTISNVVVTNILIVLSFITAPMAWANYSLLFVLNEDDASQEDQLANADGLIPCLD